MASDREPAQGKQAGNEPDAGPSSRSSANAEYAQALREISRGEQTAAALEKNLSSLEDKLDELLAAFEEDGAVEKGPVENGQKQGKGEEKKEKE